MLKKIQLFNIIVQLKNPSQCQLQAWKTWPYTPKTKFINVTQNVI